ncbi:sensor histidine kinase [Aeoliella sp. SH292]|uniref:sensor histidine kinase n=1 Tax=Aeoliella sp. SH292 TaxID=3454464 RepID=UPI003F9566F4
MNSQTALDRRTDEILHHRQQQLYSRTDRLFARLFVIQWIAAIGGAAILSPLTWQGEESRLHAHLWAAVVLGGVLAAAPIAMAYFKPGHFSTRLTISVAQAGYSALLIYISGGRLETHFHIFGSLAFLAFYRDWRVLVPATTVVAFDHLVRGTIWPETIFGVLIPSIARALEHTGWVLFEDLFLGWSCITGVREMREASRTQARLEQAKADTEEVVRERTSDLQLRSEQLEASIDETRRMAQRLAEAQKLECIGQLAAGIAHEINTPMQFIGDNSLYLEECVDRLLDITESYIEMLNIDSPSQAWEDRHQRSDAILAGYRYAELVREVPCAFAENRDGIDRVITIVRAMKDFSHPGTGSKVPTDINQLIHSTVAVSRNRWKYVARVELQLADDLPMADALPAELNQVLLNLVVNAADAIRDHDVDSSDPQGIITIRTFAAGGNVVIEVQDNGPGIPPHVKSRIFDQFFTTKEPGKGTGQGLAISHDIVVNKHSGEISAYSVVGEGTTFTVTIPIVDTEAEEERNQRSAALELARHAYTSQ